MCSMNDDPSTYDVPITAPRRYVLSGTPRKPSIALAVIGTMLTEAEDDLERMSLRGSGLAWEVAVAQVDVLREVRNRVMAAEAKL